jgi:prevent-host-death family protein
MTKTLPISEVRLRLPDLVEEASRSMERVIITRKGKPHAVLMGHEEFESWAETLEVLSSPTEMAKIREGLADLAKGNVVSYEEAFGEPPPHARKTKRKPHAPRS